MKNRVYISCDFTERDLPEVKHLCGHLQSAGRVIEFAPAMSRDFYPTIERIISDCEVFIAIVGVGYNNSIGLNHELEYAYNLRQEHSAFGPRLFAMRIGDTGLPKCSAHIPVEWFNPGDYGLILR